MFKFLNASSYMRNANSDVDDPGPPSGIAYTMSKLDSRHMMKNSETMISVRFMCGSVMRTSSVVGPAPSILADSEPYLPWLTATPTIQSQVIEVANLPSSSFCPSAP